MLAWPRAERKHLSANISCAGASLILARKLSLSAIVKPRQKQLITTSLRLYWFLLRSKHSPHTTSNHERIKILRCLCPKMSKTVSTLDDYSPPRPVSTLYVSAAFALGTTTDITKLLTAPKQALPLNLCLRSTIPKASVVHLQAYGIYRAVDLSQSASASQRS